MARHSARLVPFSVLIVSTLTALSHAYSVPPNLQTFYNNVKNGGCKSYIQNKHNEGDGQGHKGWGFCNDTPGIVYLSGPKSLGDMDIDCDGSSACGGDGSFQPQTAFDDILTSRKYGIKSLNAGVHAYTVLGTKRIAVDTLTGGPVPPLSIVAVICNGQLHYSVFGDTNGEDVTGEGSYALAQLCFPKEGLNGNNGHTPHDVLYIAFTDPAAVPGPKGAAWTTKDPKIFEASLKSLGDKLIAGKFGGSHSGSPPSTTTKKTTTPTPKPTTTCSWAGHCAGASCKSENDCSDDLICKSGKCSKPVTQNIPSSGGPAPAQNRSSRNAMNVLCGVMFSFLSLMF